jgi:predicted dehydrogenase/threonine dehydrogenase-like Zn-dependent dehydrogenase
MEQLTQLLKNGAMEILEVPFPALMKGQVMVRNYYSLISAGTEGKTVKDARLGYIGKARARKDDVRKIIEAAKTFGIKDTYRMVMNKLESPSPLGYSCVGEVIAVADDVHDFFTGDIVACGGGSANHAEVVSVPVNLCVKVPASVNPAHAAFTTVAAIALQGIRQADLRLGENAVVVGLGLVGQLTVQLLNAAGIQTIGIDVNDKMVQLAKENGCALALRRSQEDLESTVLQATNGHGCDAVIITAATDSTDPVDLAGTLCRKKGKVIIVGAVPTGFKRQNYYHKELELRMSCSYGPGRYDAEYEEQGIDYPYAYSRWTENRNMEAFVELLRSGKISVAKLHTHTFDFKEAPRAFQMILEKTESFLGVLLKYDLKQQRHQGKIQVSEKKFSSGSANVGMIGAGSFGQNFLLPAMQGHANLIGVTTAHSHTSRNVADKFGFGFCTGNAADILTDQKINTVFIATRHDTHAAYVLEALRHGKNIFVEKPLCIHTSDLEIIKNEYEKSNVLLMVGFNRRFAPLIRKMKLQFGNDLPKSIHYRVNAGSVSSDHWVHDSMIGGGRIIGEVCHFIDLCMFFAGSKITGVSAYAMKDNLKTNDTLTINLSFKNGSIANICYFSNGSKKLQKEYIEVFGSNMVAVCDDFRTLTMYGKSKTKTTTTQDKGHKDEVVSFIDSVKNGKPSPVSFDEIYLSTLATFKVIESLTQNGKEQRING